MQAPPGSIQTTFLEQLKKKLPKNLSLVDELAELLNISHDSAYRRIRGETVLSLDEVAILTKRFGVSIDSILSPATDLVSFQMRSAPKDFTLEKWLRSLSGHLDTIISSPEKEKEMVFDAKDLPVFHFFQYPRLTAFKLFFWMKFFSGEPTLTLGKYNQHLVGKEFITLAEKIWEKYTQIPTTEIIRDELLTATLRQIEYLNECGLFTDKQDALDLCDDCSQLVNHLQQQSKMGAKVPHGNEADISNLGKFRLYLNEILIGDNTILFKLGEMRMAFITPNNFNLLTTSNGPFCAATEYHMNNLIDKSVLISGTAEKERSKFFNRVEKNIQELKKVIK